MASVNTTAELNNNFKIRYADRLEKLHFDEYPLQMDIPWNKSKKLGDEFHMPALLQREQGVTYYPSGVGLQTLDAAVASNVQKAKVQGFQMLMRSAIDYESLVKGDGSGEHAFEDTNRLILESMVSSFRHRTETWMLYGQDELAVIGSVAGAVLTISAAEWGPGIWSGAKGAKIEIFDTAGTTYRGSATLDGVNISNRTLTLDALPAGTVATDRVFWKTERTTTVENVPAGIHKILSNTGTLFNIDASLYDLWMANTFDVGSTQLSIEAALDGFALAMPKGLTGKAKLCMSPATFSKMMTDQAALRRHGDPNKSAEYVAGAKGLRFFTQGGEMEVRTHVCIKEGYAYLLQTGDWMRIGASDMTFKTPGFGGKFFRHLSDQTGLEVRAYSHQALFCRKPGHGVIFTNIVN